MRAAAASTLVPTSLAALSATAWLVMWRFGDAPWGHWLHAHGVPGGPHAHGPSSSLSLAGLFIVGWLVMTVAMMLPTTLPLVAMFRRLTAGSRHPTQLAGWLVSGYLLAWAGFGLLVFATMLTIQAGAARAGLVFDARIVAGALFLVAGAFQFSALKYRCLDKCRSPFAFLTSRWRGHAHRRQSFRIGVAHGVYCVGCCWALMLLMFAVGSVNLLWMLALAMVMAVEKNLPWGGRLSAPLGSALLAVAAVLLLS